MRGQGAIAYLVMISAVLTIAVTTIVILNSMITPTQAATFVVEDKYTASIVGIQLEGYDKPWNGGTSSGTAPKTIKYGGFYYSPSLYENFDANVPGVTIVEIGFNKYFGKFDLNFNGDEFWLQTFNSKFVEGNYDSTPGLTPEQGECIADALSASEVTEGSSADDILSEWAIASEGCGVDLSGMNLPAPLEADASPAVKLLYHPSGGGMSNA